MDTSPDSDGDDVKVAKHSHCWQPPKANGFTASASKNKQHMPSAAPEHDNHEFQQTHAAEAARHQAARHEVWTGAMASMESPGQRTTGRRHSANADPAAAGVAEEGLKNWGGRRAQVPQAPSPGASPEPSPEGSVHHQHQEPLRPRQPTKHSKRGPRHRCATGARSTGPQSKQRPRRASAEASASRRLAAEAIADEQELGMKQAKEKARLDAERERGAQLGLWLGRSYAAPQLRFDNFSPQPTSLIRNPYVVASSLATDLESVAQSLAHSAHTAFDSFESHPGTAHQVFISWFDLCWFVSPEAAVQTGPAGFAQLLVALERAGVAARSRVVREPTRPAAECAAPAEPKMLQPRLAPSSSTASSSSSPPSPPPSPPSFKSPRVDLMREGPWTPEESVELIDWLAHV